ncbi:MAG: threonine/serine dehydratase [Rhodobacteraceae bacterium]|nr:threonine/serine dehydratase [Paracoccaceae bacterium]
MTNIAMVEAAAKRLAGKAQRTPLLSSPFLDKIARRRLFVKAECLQHTGSFKFRGAWSAISALPEEDRAKGVIAFSSGNHAQGVAMAAQRHGIASVIIMPSDAPTIKIENTRALGAEVVLYDRDRENRAEVAAQVNMDRGLTLIKPFDNAYVIAGQGTTGLEIAEQARSKGVEDADTLVCCGGGGLTSGIALALEKHAPGLRVRPCEPEHFDDVTRSLLSGRIEVNKRTSGSLCDAIITPSPGEMTFPILNRLCGPGIVVSEEECLHAMVLAFERLKIVVEPGGAAALAAALFHGDRIKTDDVIAVATGGNVDKSIFQQALQRFGETE